MGWKVRYRLAVGKEGERRFLDRRFVTILIFRYFLRSIRLLEPPVITYALELTQTLIHLGFSQWFGACTQGYWSFCWGLGILFLYQRWCWSCH